MTGDVVPKVVRKHIEKGQDVEQDDTDVGAASAESFETCAHPLHSVQTPFQGRLRQDNEHNIQDDGYKRHC